MRIPSSLHKIIHFIVEVYTTAVDVFYKATSTGVLLNGKNVLAFGHIQRFNMKKKSFISFKGKRCQIMKIPRNKRITQGFAW